MNGKPLTLAGKRRNLVHPVSRWLNVLFAIFLAFATSGAGKTPQVQADQYDVNISIWIEATQIGAQHTICVDDTVDFRVSVLRKVDVGNILSIVRPLPNIEVTATVNGAGSITPSTTTISAISGLPGSETFTFTAKEVGPAAVVFSAQVDPSVALGVPLLGIGGDKVDVSVELMVEDCKYKLNLVTTWRVPGEAQMTFSATIAIAGLVEELPGYYKGTARVEWRAFVSGVLDCKGTLTPESQATVTANANREHQTLTVRIEYSTAEVTLTVHCEKGGEAIDGEQTFQITPATIEDKTDLDGGPIGDYQNLLVPTGSIKGPASGRVRRIGD